MILGVNLSLLPCSAPGNQTSRKSPKYLEHILTILIPQDEAEQRPSSNPNKLVIVEGISPNS